MWPRLAAAIDHFGLQRGLPLAYSGYRGYGYVEPLPSTLDTVRSVGSDPGRQREHVTVVREVTPASTPRSGCVGAAHTVAAAVAPAAAHVVAACLLEHSGTAAEGMAMSTIDSGAAGPTEYPVQFDVDYPEQGLDRLTTFFRLFMMVPIAIVAAFVNGLLFLPPLLLILFRRKYPRWWFDWNLELLRFSNRINVYFVLLRDEYPSTDERQAVHLDIRYPEAHRELNRWLPLVKWLLAIPHYIVLFFLGIAAVVVVIISWFAILFTGGYPRSLFGFVVGVLRWSNRVSGYAFLLVTDVYPPFRLGP